MNTQKYNITPVPTKKEFLIKSMFLNDFDVKRNKVLPNECYSYVLKIEDLKFEIFTLDFGKNYISTIEKLEVDKRYYLHDRMKGNDLMESLTFFKSFNI